MFSAHHRKHAVELQHYHNELSLKMCFWPKWNLDSSQKQKRKPIYPFVRKWSKFLKNCPRQTTSHELLRFGQQSQFSLQSRLLLKLSYNGKRIRLDERVRGILSTTPLQVITRAQSGPGLVLVWCKTPASGRGVSTHQPHWGPRYIVRKSKPSSALKN